MCKVIRINAHYKVARRLFVFVIAASVFGCKTTQVSSPECLVFSICSLATLQLAIADPEILSPDVDTKGPGHALAVVAPEKITKKGSACTHMVLGTFSWGDASIYQAKKNADAKTIATVDYEQFSVLYFVYSSFCTHVSGV